MRASPRARTRTSTSPTTSRPTVIADPRVQGVSVTGSERAGAAVAEVAGRNLKKVALELGGSDPFILLSTDDLDAAVQAAVDARLDNTGQSCNAAKRFIVVDGLYDAFLEKFTAAMSGREGRRPVRRGHRARARSRRSLAAERLAEQVDKAVAQGATLVAGGTRDGAFYPGTVLTGVTPDMDAYREEFFGPVGVVYRVADEDEAVKIANDTSFGLGSYVFTTDEEQAERVADKIDAGMVYVNLVLADSPELPFGGVKRMRHRPRDGSAGGRRVRQQEAHPGRRLKGGAGLVERLVGPQDLR